jgi:Flp pilus assembly protein TadD
MERGRAAAGSGTELSEAPEATLPSLLARGDALLTAGDPSRALITYLKAHDLDLGHPAPLLRIASLHLPREPDRSVAIFQELASREPAAPGPKTGLGLARVAQGDYAAAEILLRQALDVEPDYPAALNALGLVLEQRNAHEEARQRFTRAAELQPLSYVPLNNLGVSYLTNHDDHRAEEALRRASLLEHRDPVVFNNLGIALGRIGRFEDALEAFRRAGPEHAAWNNLGFVHYERREVGAAIEAYEKALLASPIDDRLEILRNLDLAIAVRDG